MRDKDGFDNTGEVGIDRDIVGGVDQNRARLNCCKIFFKLLHELHALIDASVLSGK